MIPPSKISPAARCISRFNRGRFDKSTLNISKWRREFRRFYDSVAENVSGFGGRSGTILTR